MKVCPKCKSKDITENVYGLISESGMKALEKELEDGKNILLSAHGNSLRALFLILNFYTAETISTAEMPTGKPFIIEYENNKITNKYFL